MSTALANIAQEIHSNLPPADALLRLLVTNVFPERLDDPSIVAVLSKSAASAAGPVPAAQVSAALAISAGPVVATDPRGVKVPIHHIPTVLKPASPAVPPAPSIGHDGGSDGRRASLPDGVVRVTHAAQQQQQQSTPHGKSAAANLSSPTAYDSVDYNNTQVADRLIKSMSPVSSSSASPAAYASPRQNVGDHHNAGSRVVVSSPAGKVIMPLLPTSSSSTTAGSSAAFSSFIPSSRSHASTAATGGAGQPATSARQTINAAAIVSLKEFLLSCKLDDFLAPLQSQIGVSCIDDLFEVTDGDMDSVGMKLIQKRRLVQALERWRTVVQPELERISPRKEQQQSNQYDNAASASSDVGSGRSSSGAAAGAASHLAAAAADHQQQQQQPAASSAASPAKASQNHHQHQQQQSDHGSANDNKQYPFEWEEYKTKDNFLYYHNPRTNVTQWLRPLSNSIRTIQMREQELATVQQQVEERVRSTLAMAQAKAMMIRMANASSGSNSSNAGVAAEAAGGLSVPMVTRAAPAVPIRPQPQLQATSAAPPTAAAAAQVSFVVPGHKATVQYEGQGSVAGSGDADGGSGGSVPVARNAARSSRAAWGEIDAAAKQQNGQASGPVSRAGSRRSSIVSVTSAAAVSQAMAIAALVLDQRHEQQQQPPHQHDNESVASHTTSASSLPARDKLQYVDQLLSELGADGFASNNNAGNRNGANNRGSPSHQRAADYARAAHTAGAQTVEAVSAQLAMAAAAAASHAPGARDGDGGYTDADLIALQQEMMHHQQQGQQQQLNQVTRPLRLPPVPRFPRSRSGSVVKGSDAGAASAAAAYTVGNPLHNAPMTVNSSFARAHIMQSAGSELARVDHIANDADDAAAAGAYGYSSAVMQAGANGGSTDVSVYAGIAADGTAVGASMMTGAASYLSTPRNPTAVAAGSVAAAYKSQAASTALALRSGSSAMHDGPSALSEFYADVFSEMPQMDEATMEILARSHAIANPRRMGYSDPRPDVRPLSSMTGVTDDHRAERLQFAGSRGAGGKAFAEFASGLRAHLYAPRLDPNTPRTGSEVQEHWGSSGQAPSQVATGYAYRHAAALSRWAGQGSVYDRLTDHRGFTGTHKHRFDGDGRGTGLAGRDGAIDVAWTKDSIPEQGQGAPFLTDHLRSGYGGAATSGKVGSTRVA